MSLRCRVVAGIAAIGLSALAVSDDALQHQADVSSVRAAVEGLIAADNDEDLNRVLGFYADNAVLLTPAGDDVVGSKAIRSHYEQLFTDVDFEIQLIIDEIVVSGEWAIVRGTNDVAATTTNGTSRVRSKFLMSLRRQSSDIWRVAHLMWSNQPTSHE